MQTTQSLANHFLIALPTLSDPSFAHSVTYICEHTEEGALGIVINLPLEAKLKELLDFFDLESVLTDEQHSQFLLAGGPVEKERGFILHSPVGSWETTLPVSDDIALTTSEDILEAIANNEGPKKHLVALGYAGWDAGQLEQELQENAWLFAPANTSLLFDTPLSQRWERSHELLGINWSQLASEQGTA